MLDTTNRVAAAPFAERVAAGADFLDHKVPGWAKRINPRALDVSSCVRCVLGQLFDHYSDGLAFLDVEEGDSTVRLGFDLDLAELGRDSYAGLTAAWADAVRARRGAVGQ